MSAPPPKTILLSTPEISTQIRAWQSSADSCENNFYKFINKAGRGLYPPLPLLYPAPVLFYDFAYVCQVPGSAVSM